MIDVANLGKGYQNNEIDNKGFVRTEYSFSHCLMKKNKNSVSAILVKSAQHCLVVDQLITRRHSTQSCTQELG